MNDFYSLKLLDKFSGMFKRFGIEYEMMRKILEMKLTMDQRRVPTIFSQSKKKEGNYFFKSLWIYALYGLILIPFILLGDNYMFQMSLVFGMVQFILMTSMISDFSTVLLDVRDKTIISTKPIKRRTISLAKIIHVGIYMSLLMAAFLAIPFITGVFTQGILFSLIFLVELVLNGLFIVVFTALIYIFILRFFSGERLKDIINYVQILLSVGIVVGYQLLIRSFEFVDLNVTFGFQWWHVLIPAMWYGAPYELLLHHNYSLSIIVLSILALVVPIFSILLYYRLLPSFERNLQKLLNNSGNNKKKREGWDFIWTWVTFGSKEERLFFRFASLMMKNEREFKLKVYPALGFTFIFPFIFLFNDMRSSSFTELGSGRAYLTIYFCNIMIPSVIHMLKFSGKYKASWIYGVAPIQNKSAIYSATLKAFLVKLYLPVFLFLSIIFVSIFSFRIMPDLIVVLLSGCLLSLAAYKIQNSGTYPFSESFEFVQESNTAGKVLLLMLVVGLFFGIHFIALMIPYGIYGYMLILLVVTIFGWKMTFYKASKA